MQQKLPLYYVNRIKMGKTIVARAMIENLASIRVMEKALKFEKEFGGYITLIVLMYYIENK